MHGASRLRSVEFRIGSLLGRESEIYDTGHRAKFFVGESNAAMYGVSHEIVRSSIRNSRLTAANLQIFLKPQACRLLFIKNWLPLRLHPADMV